MIDVYRNLNCRTHTEYSIRETVLVDGVKRRRVNRRISEGMLVGCVFKHASEAAAERCRTGGAKGTGCREVCQWVKCESIGESVDLGVPLRRMTCDPKNAIGFRDAETGELLTACDYVLLRDNGEAWYGNKGSKA